MIRPAEEILKENMPFGMLFESVAIHAIKVAQREAIEVCAEKSAMIYWDGFHKVGKAIGYFASGADNLQPDKQSILKLIDQIK